MIKLKIGDNFLITSNNDKEMKNFIIYMMSSFKGHNKVVLGLDMYNHGITSLDQGLYPYKDYIKIIKNDRISDLFILYNPLCNNKRTGIHYEGNLKSFILQLKSEVPNISIRVINIQDTFGIREYKAAAALYESLCLDKKSILHYLDKLDEYKTFSTRYKAIPEEIKVINENIKKMSKESKVCNRKITLSDLNYLNLIDKATLNGDRLVLDIKPLPIYPSEPLGKCIGASDFKRNPYLFKAASYLYKGYHFGMVGTRISVDSRFKPEFIETLDHTFDDMFRCHNWSTIGYLHFGQGHLCGGEFNDVIAHTAEHGLEYYFISLKQYITTANMRDIAGRKVWWYPIYDDEGKLVYCAGLDILRDYVKTRVRPEDKEKISNMPWEDFIQWKNEHRIKFTDFDLPYKELETNYNGSDDTFLTVCKEQDPVLYEEIMKGAM